MNLRKNFRRGESFPNKKNVLQIFLHVEGYICLIMERCKKSNIQQKSKRQPFVRNLQDFSPKQGGSKTVTNFPKKNLQFLVGDEELFCGCSCAIKFSDIKLLNFWCQIEI